MKQIKAFVHRNRVGDIVHALDAAGFTRLSLFDVKGMLRALSAREQEELDRLLTAKEPKK